jgi:hypothetical protein
MKDIIEILENQLAREGALVLEQERADQFIRWLKTIHVTLMQQEVVIRSMREELRKVSPNFEITWQAKV